MPLQEHWTFDMLIETARALLVAVLLVILTVSRRGKKIPKLRGWQTILTGFYLLFFAFAIDITDNFPSLSRFGFLGETALQAFLEKVVGYIGSLLFITFGFLLWLPRVVEREEARKELELLNENLEDKVIERTRKLTESLRAVRQLREQQEADYYLVSRLLSPFQASETNRFGALHINTLLVQKKLVEIKGRAAAIGGDLNFVMPLGANHVFILNADAMGKSLQGASGALLLAALVRSYLDSVSTDQNPSAETNLAELYYKIVHLFSAFSGAMTVTYLSIIANVQTGQISALQAGNPDALLLRDKTVTTVFADYSCAVPGSENPDRAVVQSLQMNPGDAIILGSDGRSDRRTPQGIPGSFEDEFRSAVKECSGDLRCLFGSMMQYGESTDDVSLVRIVFEVA